MTDREQFAILAFIIGILLLMVWWTSQPAESAQQEYEVYVIQPEDSIDGIVRARYPEENPTEMIHIVREINGKDGELLDPWKIWPGQRIKVPLL